MEVNRLDAHLCFLIVNVMEVIKKKISLEGAKNRFYGAELPILTGTSFVYDIKFDDPSNVGYDRIIPLVKNSNGENVLRYKNLIDKYYWLVNRFIPSCRYYRYCLRNGENKWIENKNVAELRGSCYVKFMNPDGTLINSIIVLRGDHCTIPNTPSKEGYTFSGWFTSATGSEAFDFNQIIEQDTVIYAHYTQQTCNVIFVYNSGATTGITTTVTVNYGESVPAELVPDADTYEGYTFVGWSDSYENVKTDKTIYASYEVQQCRILFYVDEEVYAYTDVPYGTVLERPIDPEKSNYTFVKWVVSGTTTPFDFTQPITDDYVLAADFIGNTYYITFVDWDGTVLPSITGFSNPRTYIYGGQEITVPHEFEPSRQGFAFDKWSWPDSDTGTAVYTMSGFQSNTTVVAQYTENVLTATFMLLDLIGEQSEYAQAEYGYGGFIPRPNDPSESEYDPYSYGVFDGWYTDSNYTTPFDFDQTYTQNNIIIYGKWKREFTVTFLNWDNTLISGETFENPQEHIQYGYDAVAPDESYILPYGNFRFIGFDHTLTDIKEDKTVKALFSNTKVWTVRFINRFAIGDESVIATVYVVNGGNVSSSDIPTPPEINGYMFERWDKELTNITSNLDVNAVYTPISYTVTFIDYYGNVLGTQYVQYGKTANTPQDYTVPDIEVYEYNIELGHDLLCPYTFNGQYLLVGEGQQLVPEDTVIVGDTTFQAQYTLNGNCTEELLNIVVNSYNDAYSHTYNNKYHGSVLTSAEIEALKDIMENAGLYPEPYSAYTFFGLTDIYGNEYPKEEDIILNEPMTYKMFYVYKYYTVRFIDTINGSIISSMRVPLNTLIPANSIPAAPSHENYEWITNENNTLWYTNSECTGNTYDFNVAETQETTINLYAKYERRFDITVSYLSEVTDDSNNTNNEE